MDFAGLMVGVSGVRGRVGDALTPEIVSTFAAAFGSLGASSNGQSRAIVVGRDSRVSGHDVHARGSRRARSQLALRRDRYWHGAHADCANGEVEHHHAAGGLAITASHNPIEWNALKFIGPSGTVPLVRGRHGRCARCSSRRCPTFKRATWDKLGRIASDEGRRRPSHRADTGAAVSWTWKASGRGEFLRCTGHAAMAPAP